MVNPRLLNDDHNVFICGNDGDAKAVKDLLGSFGWRQDEIIDLGDISAARGTEMLLPLWLRIYDATKTGKMNFKIAR